MASGTTRRRFHRMTVRRQVHFVASIVVLLLTVGLEVRCAATAGATDTETKCLSGGRPHAQRSGFIVDSVVTCAPEGVFLAVRKGGSGGVVRFFNVQDVNEGVEGCARYEFYSRDGRNRKFTVDSGVVSYLGSTGVHPVVVARGNQTIRGRGLSLRYSHPGCVWLLGQPELEVAPTPWRSIEEVDLTDQRLRWYRLDPSQKRDAMVISLDDLQTLFR